VKRRLKGLNWPRTNNDQYKKKYEFKSIYQGFISKLSIDFWAYNKLEIRDQYINITYEIPGLSGAAGFMVNHVSKPIAEGRIIDWISWIPLLLIVNLKYARLADWIIPEDIQIGKKYFGEQSNWFNPIGIMTEKKLLMDLFEHEKFDLSST